MNNIEKGIKLRSGKVILPRESYYDDSDSDDFSFGCERLPDGRIKPLLADVPSPPPHKGFLLDYDDDDNESPFLTYDEYEKEASVTESIEKKVISELEVPNGFGDEAGKYLEIFNRSYRDCEIGFNQFSELVKGFGKCLSWFPDDVPQEKVKKFCKEAYDRNVFNLFVNGDIERRQLFRLM